MARFNVNFRTDGGRLNVAFRTDPGLPSSVIPLSVTENGDYDAGEDGAFNPVHVAVPRNLTITFLTNSMAMAARTLSPPVDKLTLHNTYTGASGISLSSMCNNLSGASILEVLTDKPMTSMRGAFGSVNIANIILTSLDFSVCTDFNGCFGGNSIEGLEIIVTGTPLDLSNVTTSANLTNLIGQNVKDIRFVPSCCNVSWQLAAPIKASDDTLVSVANALNGSVTGQTLTLHSSKKARCGEIVGTVTDGIFAIDAHGGMTLTEFITNTKGWTLA